MVAISIVVTSYSTQRFNDIRDLLYSIEHQIQDNFEVIYVTEGSEALHQMIADKLNSLGLRAKTIRNEGVHDLPVARNLGSANAVGDILAFVGDDVVLNPNWTFTAEKAFTEHRDAVGITGPTIPLWVDEQANWFPKEFDWLIGCTRWFKVKKVVDVCNCWGMNTAFRRTEFVRVGGFSEESTEKSRYLGSERQKSSLNGSRRNKGLMAEDVDLSFRIRSVTQGRLLYVPSLLSYGKVHEDRLWDRYVIQRSSWIGHTRRNFNRTMPQPDFASKSFEAYLLPKIFLLLANYKWSTQNAPADVRKRYRLVLLSLTSLLVGFILGAIQ